MSTWSEIGRRMTSVAPQKPIALSEMRKAYDRVKTEPSPFDTLVLLPDQYTRLRDIVEEEFDPTFERAPVRPLGYVEVTVAWGGHRDRARLVKQLQSIGLRVCIIEEKIE